MHQPNTQPLIWSDVEDRRHRSYFTCVSCGCLLYLLLSCHCKSQSRTTHKRRDTNTYPAQLTNTNSHSKILNSQFLRSFAVVTGIAANCAEMYGHRS